MYPPHNHTFKRVEDEKVTSRKDKPSVSIFECGPYQKLAGLALSGLKQIYPTKITHLLNDDNDIKPPNITHPAFYGCWDVHSSIHGFYVIVCVLGKDNNSVYIDSESRRTLTERLSEANITVETEYFQAPNRQSFERPYGWAWILMLQAEIKRFFGCHPNDLEARKWYDNVDPLAQYIVGRFKEYLCVRFPNRDGYVFFFFLIDSQVYVLLKPTGLFLI